MVAGSAAAGFLLSALRKAPVLIAAAIPACSAGELAGQLRDVGSGGG